MKIRKIAMIVAILFAIVLGLASNVTATINPEDFKPHDISTIDYWTAAQKGATILNIIVTIGVVISVVMFMVLGMKYMMGSVEQKADYKKDMLPMLVGTVMLFTITTIVGIIGNIVANFE